MHIQGENPGDIVKRLIELIEYQDHLKKHNDDWESRWDNVDELVNFASEFECISSSSDVAKAQDDWMDTVDDEDTFAESGLPPHRSDEFVTTYNDYVLTKTSWHAVRHLYARFCKHRCWQPTRKQVKTTQHRKM